jgi:hypothetical protein
MKYQRPTKRSENDDDDDEKNSVFKAFSFIHNFKVSNLLIKIININSIK